MSEDSFVKETFGQLKHHANKNKVVIIVMACFVVFASLIIKDLESDSSVTGQILFAPTHGHVESIESFNFKINNINEIFDQTIAEVDLNYVTLRKNYCDQIFASYSQYFYQNLPAGQTTVDDCGRIAMESYDLSERFRKLKKKFLKLHDSYVHALAKGNMLTAMQIDKQIKYLFDEEFSKAEANNIDITPGLRLHELANLGVDTPYSINMRDNILYSTYISK